jgi:hypothetical protein
MFKTAYKKLFKRDIITLRQYQPIFGTIDGVRHEGVIYNWAILERLRVSVPEYLMIDINSDGYIMDKDRVMYPIHNVKSITWEIVRERKMEDTFNDYTIFVSKLPEQH